MKAKCKTIFYFTKLNIALQAKNGMFGKTEETEPAMASRDEGL
ncbi:MAG TPA: hypothetical protein VF775_05055 [Geobacteraceae bacterium]|jgi:hypothetical protein